MIMLESSINADDYSTIVPVLENEPREIQGHDGANGTTTEARMGHHYACPKRPKPRVKLDSTHREPCPGRSVFFDETEWIGVRAILAYVCPKDAILKCL